MDDLTKMIYSLSIPVIKEVLYSIVDKCERTDLYGKIDELCPVGEIGSFKVTYQENGVKKDAYILLQICNVNHDLTLQFDKIKQYTTDDQWKQILKCLSSMIFIVRTIYIDMYNKLELDDIDYKELQVDPINTTLYIPNLSKRIGIFIDKCEDL